MPLNKLNLNSEIPPKPIITNSVSLIAPPSNINNNLRLLLLLNYHQPPYLLWDAILDQFKKKMDSTTTFFKIN